MIFLTEVGFLTLLILGTLDMRMDEPTDVPKIPTASDVLQHIDERDLIRMLKAYGGLKTKAKYVAEAILEARYMFHHFKTTQVSITAMAEHYCCEQPLKHFTYTPS